MSTDGIAFHRSDDVRCPECGSPSHIKRASGRFHCNNCKLDYTLGESMAAASRATVGRPRKRRASAGSGVIAGRIEIGRGSVWGAGLV